MKKIYTTLFISSLAIFSFAQQRTAHGTVANVGMLNAAIKNQPVQPMGTMDTLTNAWDVVLPASAQVDTIALYSLGTPPLTGYVGGQNSYHDKGKAQKFDSNFGVTSSGTVKSVLFWFGAKMSTSGTATYTATIWDDNAGKPGTVLGTATPFTIASIDTTSAGQHRIGPPTAVEGGYNVVATFTTPVNIPANKTFWAGMTFNYVTGDSAGLLSTSDGKYGDAPGMSGNFPQAGTHTFDQWSDNSWNSVNDGTNNSWQLDIAYAIFPVVDLAAGVNENNSIVASFTNAPNPARDNTVLSYELKEATNVNVSVFDITGKELMSLNQGAKGAGAHSLKINVSELPAGMYFCTLTAGNYQSTQKLNVIK